MVFSFQGYAIGLKQEKEV